jgi:hypothetical protein
MRWPEAASSLALPDRFTTPDYPSYPYKIERRRPPAGEKNGSLRFKYRYMVIAGRASLPSSSGGLPLC